MAKKEKDKEPIRVTAALQFVEVAPAGLQAVVDRFPNTASRISWLKVFLSHAWEVALRHEPGEALAKVVESNV